MSERQYLDEHHLCWEENGELHIDARKACIHFGYPPTNENQNTIVKAMLNAASELMPKAKQRVIDDSTGCEHELADSNACVKCGWSLDQGGPMGGA